MSLDDTWDAFEPEMTRGQALNELRLMRAWITEACEELEDIRSQWGGDYLWEKHNERYVVDLTTRARVAKWAPERPGVGCEDTTT